MQDQQVQEALSDARSWALTRPRFDDSPADSDSAAMESIRQLEQLAPSAGTAAALLSAAAARPQPVDRESLKPTADPLPTLTAIEEHLRRNPADGCAVAAGPQLNGSTVFALRGPVAGLRAWLGDVGCDDTYDKYGRASKSYKATTPYVVVRWSPPVTQARSVSSFGADIDSAHRHLVGDRDRRAVAGRPVPAGCGSDHVPPLCGRRFCGCTRAAQRSGRRGRRRGVAPTLRVPGGWCR